MLYPPNKVNYYLLILNFKEVVSKWVIQRSIEEEEKWAQKKEELVKETKENKNTAFNENR